MPLTPDAKKLLAETIRGTQLGAEGGLRACLLRAIHDEADRRYRLSVPIGQAGLDEAHKKRRERIEAWVDERARATKPKSKAELQATAGRLLQQAEKDAAATLINRLVLLRQLEALGLSKPAVLTGGWNSRGYREFREFAPPLCTNGAADGTEGYATLLQLVFDELAIELPGLFGDVGLTRLFPVPAATLREVVERIDAPELASAWTDDTTLGWVYQYWNDPDREALDAKINGGGKIEPHEIASKTQMFTERYMVEWLLQNSLGLTWLHICRKHGWKPDAETILPVLETRRAEWRRRRETGEVSLDALMPIDGELEEHWKYFVPQPILDDAVERVSDSVRSLRILDPACGSGHFLVIAFGLLAALYREESRHRGEPLSEREIAEMILENNLFGIDIDPRAIQLAAAGLFLKAKSLAKNARPKRLNLVAPVLHLGNLPPDDPAVSHLRQDLKREVGIPEELTDKLLASLAGVDYLGSLLKVDAAVEDAIRSVEFEFEQTRGQGAFFPEVPKQQVKLSFGAAKASIVDKLEQFLAKHSTSEDLGLRLDGEELAAGVRFMRIAREGAYDLVVGNPPYSDMGLLVESETLIAAFPDAKANLYSCFLVRGLQLTSSTGLCAMLTMRGWLFIKDYELLRRRLFTTHDLRSVGDFDRGAFDAVPNDLLSVAITIFRKECAGRASSVAIQPSPFDDRSYDRERTARKRAATLAHLGRYEFAVDALRDVPGWPLVFWWSVAFLAKYVAAPKVARAAPVRQGMATSDNPRFLRRPWELDAPEEGQLRHGCGGRWAAYIKGADGIEWCEPLRFAVRWQYAGLELKVFHEHRHGSYSKRIPSERFYFRLGIAFSTIGDTFSARLHMYPSIFDAAGCSIFPEDRASMVCLLNSSQARFVLQSLNPTISFKNNDVERLCVVPIANASEVSGVLTRAFQVHEEGRETSVEFRRPQASAWASAQVWAQAAVDRSPGEALAPYQERVVEPSPDAFMSFAVGIALGRFVTNETGDSLKRACPGGILYLSGSGNPDSLHEPRHSQLVRAWFELGAQLGGGDLRTYLQRRFFERHKQLYQARPIYLPLSSAKRRFVAFVSIHRWRSDTLGVLLADYLVPERRRLEGEVEDLRIARASGNKGKAEKRFAEVQKLLEELNDFITNVTEVADRGPPPPDGSTPKREVDAHYVMDLDDGVMVNSAALWSLLEPQWEDPGRWWKELATARGKKDCDWSHLAARYFPTRVREKCRDDPSLAVAHQCFWELHPAKAYAWELRLQGDIRPGFLIEEPGSDAARARFLAEQARQAQEIRAGEMKRRERKASREYEESGGYPLFDRGGEDHAEEPGDD